MTFKIGLKFAIFCYFSLRSHGISDWPEIMLASQHACVERNFDNRSCGDKGCILMLEFRPIFIMAPGYQQHKMLLELILKDNQLYVCTVLQIYFTFVLKYCFTTCN